MYIKDKICRKFYYLKICSSILLNYSYPYKKSSVAKTLNMHACVYGDDFAFHIQI